ncbi:hypothetical protein ACGFNP_03570 [Nonomuraea sp. NPDC049269]|uniref:hypothetical protein n=1 Tax=Nonomuraea sp. NPDC049269 TaxID=3364349 RepID=UPI00371144DF
MSTFSASGGRSGVWVDNPASGNTTLNSERFRAWAESGFADEALGGSTSAIGIKRRNQILEWPKPGNAADEYGECNRVGWDKCD